MKDLPKILLIAAFLTASLLPACALQTGLTEDIPAHNIGIEFAAYPEFFLELEYQYVFKNLADRIDVTLHAVFGMPMFLIPKGDSFHFETGASVRFFKWKGLALTGSLMTAFSTAGSRAGFYVNWRFSLGFLAGYFVRKWFIGLQCTWTPTVATYVVHSDWARDAFEDRYPVGTDLTHVAGAPSDGWYAGGSHRIMIGMTVGGTIKRLVTPYLAGGFSYEPNAQGLVAFPDIGMLPFYVQTGVKFHWGNPER
jgi:hypothetical protein